MHTVLKNGRHYMISSDIHKMEKGKQFFCKFGNFVLPTSMRICSVNVDCETSFLTLSGSVGKIEANIALES